MKKFLACILSVACLAGIGAPAAAADSMATKRTFIFSAGAAKLSNSQISQIKQFATANKSAYLASCFGYRLANSKASEVQGARLRAQLICDEIKKQIPGVIIKTDVIRTGNKSQLNRVVATLNNSAKLLDLNSYDPAAVSTTALAKVNEYLARVPAGSKLSYELKAGVNVGSNYVEQEKKRLEKSLVFWSTIYSESPVIFLYTGSDVDWMVRELNALGNSHHDNLIRNESWKKTGICAQSLAMAHTGRDYYVACQRPGNSDDRSSIVPAHEFAHLPIWSKFKNQPGGEQSQTPVWANEGGAEFFGLTLTDQSVAAGFTYWNQVHMNANGSLQLSGRPEPQSLRKILLRITESEAVDLLTKLENTSALQSDMPYSVGRWATELLIASYGVEKYFEFLNGMSSSIDWRSSFSNAYGMKVEDFYKKTARYLEYLSRKV